MEWIHRRLIGNLVEVDGRRQAKDAASAVPNGDEYSAAEMRLRR